MKTSLRQLPKVNYEQKESSQICQNDHRLRDDSSSAERELEAPQLKWIFPSKEMHISKLGMSETGFQVNNIQSSGRVGNKKFHLIAGNGNGLRAFLIKDFVGGKNESSTEMRALHQGLSFIEQRCFAKNQFGGPLQEIILKKRPRSELYIICSGVQPVKHSKFPSTPLGFIVSAALVQRRTQNVLQSKYKKMQSHELTILQGDNSKFPLVDEISILMSPPTLRGCGFATFLVQIMLSNQSSDVHMTTVRTFKASRGFYEKLTAPFQFKEAPQLFNHFIQPYKGSGLWFFNMRSVESLDFDVDALLEKCGQKFSQRTTKKKPVRNIFNYLKDLRPAYTLETKIQSPQKAQDSQISENESKTSSTSHSRYIPHEDESQVASDDDLFELIKSQPKKKRAKVSCFENKSVSQQDEKEDHSDEEGMKHHESAVILVKSEDETHAKNCICDLCKSDALQLQQMIIYDTDDVVPTQAKEVPDSVYDLERAQTIEELKDLKGLLNKHHRQRNPAERDDIALQIQEITGLSMQQLNV